MYPFISLRNTQTELSEIISENDVALGRLVSGAWTMSPMKPWNMCQPASACEGMKGFFSCPAGEPESTAAELNLQRVTTWIFTGGPFFVLFKCARSECAEISIFQRPAES